jgi:hypothetical protein
MKITGTPLVHEGTNKKASSNKIDWPFVFRYLSQIVRSTDQISTLQTAVFSFYSFNQIDKLKKTSAAGGASASAVRDFR